MMQKLISLLSTLLVIIHVNAMEPLKNMTVAIDSIEEVVVTGTRNAIDIRHLPMQVSVMERIQIEARHEQSLLPMLNEQVPGLFVTNRGVMGYGVSTGSAGGLSLRGIGGSPTTRMLVLIDGRPQYAGLMGHPVVDAYQSMLAEKVEVLRGPASVLYGSNAMGGVINIVTDEKREHGVYTNANVSYGSYNTFTAEAANRVSENRWGTMVGASYNRTDGHRENMEFEQYTGYIKVNYELDAHWQTSADVDVTHFDAANPGSVTKLMIDNDSHITRGMGSVALENDYEMISGALRGYYNWGRHKINDGYADGSQPLTYHFNSKDQMAGMSIYQAISLFEGNRLTVGADYQYVQGEAWNRYFAKDSSAILVNKEEQEVAGYIDFRQTFGRLMTLDMGLRADRHTQSGTEWVPQLGVSIHLHQTAELKLSAAKGFRNPTLKELYMFRSQNPDLRSEKLWNYELSFSQRLKGGAIRYGANVFYIKGDNLIQTMPIDGKPTNINTGKIENWGAEMEFACRMNDNWSMNANYSWLHMEKSIVAAPEHKFYVGGNFTKARWVASSGIQYVEGLYTSVDTDTKENFVQWNVRASYQATQWMQLFLRGENLLSQKYEINAGYPMPRTTVFAGVNLKL